MSDICIDFDVLKRVRTNLEHIGELMERPGQEMEEADGDALGVSMLASRMNDFGDAWSYGIKQIKKFSGAAVKTLDKMPHITRPDTQRVQDRPDAEQLSPDAASLWQGVRPPPRQRSAPREPMPPHHEVSRS